MNFPDFEQRWELGPVGNWKSWEEDDGDGGTKTINMDQTHDKNNQIKTLNSNSAPSGWQLPVYDKNGNMMTMSTIADPTKKLNAEYDAWNRVVKLKNHDNYLVAEYEYDGRNFRTSKKTYDGTVSETLDEERHSYYNSKWQLLEERTGSSPDSAAWDTVYMWGLRHVDYIIMRIRNQTTDEKLYALNDDNFNVVALFDPPVSVGGSDNGLVQRFEYDAYGICHELDDAYDPLADTHDWEIRYAGYRYDPESELYYVRNRTYHPELGRWLQRDPVGYVDGMSLYQYCVSNPLRHIDYTGLIVPSHQGGAWAPANNRGSQYQRYDSGSSFMSDVYNSVQGKVESKVKSVAENIKKSIWLMVMEEREISGVRIRQYRKEIAAGGTAKMYWGWQVKVSVNKCQVNVSGGPFLSGRLKIPLFGSPIDLILGFSVKGGIKHKFDWCCPEKTGWQGQLAGGVNLGFRFEAGVVIAKTFIEGGVMDH